MYGGGRGKDHPTRRNRSFRRRGRPGLKRHCDESVDHTVQLTRSLIRCTWMMMRYALPRFGQSRSRLQDLPE
jgi:hypothetical protein